MSQRRGIRAELLKIYALYALVPLVIVSSLVFWSDIATTREQALDRLEQRVALVGELLARELAATVSAPLRELGNQNFTTLAPESQRDRLRSLVVRLPAIQEVILIDRTGVERVKFHRDLLVENLETPIENIASVFAKLAASPKPFIADTGFDGVTGEPLVTAVTPVVDLSTATISFVLLSRHRIKSISTLIAAVPQPDHGRIYLVDNQRYILAHQNLSVVLRQTEISNGLLSQTARGLSGERALFASTQVQVAGHEFSVIAEESLWQVYAEHVRNFLGVVTLTLLFIVAFIGSMRRVTTAVIVPLERMSIAVKQIEQGNYDVRVGTGRANEIGALSDSIDGLAGSLERQIRLRSESEQALLEAEHNIRMLLESTQEGLVSVDLRGHCNFANQSALRLLSNGDDPLAGASVDDLMELYEYRSDRRQSEERIAPTSLLTDDGSAQEAMLKVGESLVPVELRAQPVLEGGEMVGHVLTFVDISTRKAAEEQLQQAQKMEAVGQLTGGVAHDFNNLLAVMQGNVELLQQRTPDETLLSYTEEIHAACKRGAALTQQLLAFARRQPLAPTAVDVNALVRRSHAMLARVLREDMEITLIMGAGLWNARVDEVQLENALLNLAINARDAMQYGGELTIETANVSLDEDYAGEREEVRAGQYVLISLSDNGSGMTHEVQARAFEPFFTTKEIGRGSGLGLSMVYGFVKQSGGHVQVYSEIGQGTSVKMYFPRMLDGIRHRSPRAPEPNRYAGAGEVILVVEDDEPVRAVTVQILETAGYQVLAACDAKSAVAAALAAERAPDLLFSDVVLTGSASGPELAQSLRTDFPRLRVLYCSGYTRNAVIHDGRLEDDVELITKPFSRTELLRRVRRLIG